MYEKITDENGYKRPMRIYPAPHYAMGGLWVDYNLMSNYPRPVVLGEANSRYTVPTAWAPRPSCRDCPMATS